MSNIILQHWTGELDELGKLSSNNIANYAKRIGAEYGLIIGNAFRRNLAPPCQKLCMLDPELDEHDFVVMLDMDMFAVTDEDIFQVEGTGLFSAYTEKVFGWCRQRHPDLTDIRYAYWGGAIYRMSLELRKTLRQHIREDEMQKFSGNFNDEGIVHRLACLAGIKQDRLPDRWCQCSYLPNPEQAAMIHIRTKTPDGTKKTKLENYQTLKRLGVL